MKSSICASPKGSGKTVGSSSVALGDWLMSPTRNLDELSSPSHNIPSNQDICFSPGMFSPTKGMTAGQDNSRSLIQFSPSIFSPTSTKLLKKRHHMSPPPSLENAFFTSHQVSGFAPSSSQNNEFYVKSYSQTDRPNQMSENLYGVRDRKRRVFHEDDMYYDSVVNSDSAPSGNKFSSHPDADTNRICRLNNNKQSRRFSPSTNSPPNESNQQTIQPPTVSPGEASTKCNCKKSKCLKLYCECFATLKYCDSCNCVDCNNNESHESKRQDAIRATKDRNVSAFQTKVASRTGHATGCNCKNSMCLKKYCECFQGGAFCANNCKCISCQNFEGSVQLDAHKNYGDKKKKGSPNSVVMVSENNTPSTNMPSSGLLSCTAESCGNFSNDSIIATPADIKSRSGAASYATFSAEMRTGLRSSRRLAEQEACTKEGIANCKHSNAILNTRKSVSFSERNNVNITYPFFGPTMPQMPKIVALQCLDFLNGRDLNSMSVVNSIWAAAATDNALWETEIV